MRRGPGWSFEPRRIFLAGLLVTLPGLVAAYVLWIAFSWLDGILRPIVQHALHRRVPGVGLFALLAVVFLVGVVASNLLGARLLRAGTRWLERIPVYSPLYRAMRDISQVFLGNKASAFGRVGFLEWPRSGTWAVVFVMAEGGSGAGAAVGGDLLTVFLPSTPNPTTGFVLLVQRDRIVPADLTVEQALKLVMSGGAAQAASLANR